MSKPVNLRVEIDLGRRRFLVLGRELFLFLFSLGGLHRGRFWKVNTTAVC
jgi:hypothetical protein